MIWRLDYDNYCLSYGPLDHGWDINDNAIDKIKDTLVDFYKTIKE